jgi:hypothetical protein
LQLCGSSDFFWDFFSAFFIIAFQAASNQRLEIFFRDDDAFRQAIAERL